MVPNIIIQVKSLSSSDGVLKEVSIHSDESKSFRAQFNNQKEQEALLN